MKLKLQVTADGWTFEYGRRKWGGKRTGDYTFEEFGTPPPELVADLEDQHPVQLAQAFAKMQALEAAAA